MTLGLQFHNDDSEPFEDHERYRKLVEKSNYLTITHSHITYHVTFDSQLMSSSIVKY